MVAAAGNMGRNNTAGTFGYGTISSPANHPQVITVGAMNDKLSPSRTDDVMTSYSSKGPTLIDHIVKPDLVAPGNRIVSLIAPGSALPKKAPEGSLGVRCERALVSTRSAPLLSAPGRPALWLSQPQGTTDAVTGQAPPVMEP